VTAELYFLPWLRRGLGIELGEPDTGQVELPRGAPVPAWVELDRVPAAVSLSLRPPDHVTGIDDAQIVRRYPEPNTVDAEYGYFPLIEFSAPDFPWVLTPAVANEAVDGRLRPWVVLVCVEEATAEYVAGDGDRPGRLLCPVSDLPNLDESYAWAHVQSVAAPSEVVDKLAAAPGSVIARLVCPRRLDPMTGYRAALVGAFAVADDHLVAAWDSRTQMPDLNVFATWTFTTGEAGSFEELCRRLGPIDDTQLQLGMHPLDVTILGAVDPWPEGTARVIVDYTGALWDTDLAARGLGELKEDFDTDVTGLLNQGSEHVPLDLNDPDPVVTPPLYGSFPAVTHEVPGEGWLRQLNLAPNRRAAAGLGADVVRQHQERFMALAWRQAGALRETNRELSVTRLQAEIGRTWRHRANRLEDLPRVTLLRPQLTFVRDADGRPPRQLLADSTFPDALASPAYLRQVRPGGVVAAAAERRAGRDAPSFRAVVAASFGDAATRRQMRFAAVGIPTGTTLPDPRRIGGAQRRPDAARALVVDDVDVADIAGLTATGIRPVGAARARITARIPALAGTFVDLPEHDLPTRVRWGPTIDEALVWLLIERSPELLLPGVGQFPPNSVRVVEANTAYVSSFLGGANHEMNRELLWREFPADLRATTFRRFWDRPDVTVRDIEPMADWDAGDTLATLGKVGGESVVLLVRGDLVMHYPTVRMLLANPKGAESLPSFGGWIPPDIRFAAFDVPDADAVTAEGSGWEVVFEEQPCEPRFGLDTGTGRERLAGWSDLTWEHLTNQDSAIHHLVVGAGGFPCAQPAPAGATWGLNGAHMARVTYQSPFRGVIPVFDLVGETS
jgi:hypothetical protein